MFTFLHSIDTRHVHCALFYRYGPLYLVKGLINVSKECVAFANRFGRIKPLFRYPWTPSHQGKLRSFLAILQCLSALSQDKLPFHACDAVQSNDILFVGDDECVRAGFYIQSLHKFTLIVRADTRLKRLTSHRNCLKKSYWTSPQRKIPSVRSMWL
jgi:hypothetical protein